MAINWIKQLLGSARGQSVDATVDALPKAIEGDLTLDLTADERAVLTAVGVTPDLPGVLSFVETAVLGAVNNNTSLTAAQKAALSALIEGLDAKIAML